MPCKKMTFLYFAYGSNLLRQRLQLDNPSAEFVTVAELKGHEIEFSNLGRDTSLNRWLGGAATITENSSSTVWGCVWRLRNEHIATLDRQEAKYFAKDVEVIARDNSKYMCRTYQLDSSCFDKNEFDHRPSPMYLDVIVRGAVQNDLPGDYINYLKNIDTNGVVKKLDIHTRLIKMINDSQNS